MRKNRPHASCETATDGRRRARSSANFRLRTIQRPRSLFTPLCFPNPTIEASFLLITACSLLGYCLLQGECWRAHPFFTSGQGFVDSQMLLSPLLPSHTVLEAPRETELGVVPCPTDSPTSSSLASSHPSMTDLTGLASSNSNDASTRRASPVDNTLGAVPVASAGVNKRHRRSYSAPLHGGRWDQLIEQATGARLGLELGCWWVTVCKWSSSNTPTPNPNTDPSNIPTPNPNTDPGDQ